MRLLFTSTLTLGYLLLATVYGIAADKPARGTDLQKNTVLEWKQLDGNQINCTIASDGPFADYRPTLGSGLEWPKGSGKSPIWTAGIWLIGRHRVSGQLRTAVVDYRPEYQPGPLLEIFNTTTNEDSGPSERADSSEFRLYKIQIGDTLSADYRDWPGHLGAPFVDIDGNGVWDKSVDHPRLYGDQQIWCVFNDVNNALHTPLGATPPIGLEVRVLYYSFDRSGVLGSTMFMRWTVINRSDADYDSVYLGIWSDVDLGDANDDMPGSDSTLCLGYAYNGDNDDGTDHGYGSTPPAVGFTLLQGPIVPGLPTDSARIGDGWVPGRRNLPATAFVPFLKAMGVNDPFDGSPVYARMAYDYLMGKHGDSGEYLRRQDSSIISWWLSGDPVAGTGDVPGNFPLGNVFPQDFRILLSSGPFTIAQGDTQEVVAALVISQGSDRLESVTLL
ncbi:MAG: hypothetical protein WBD30_05700, partial [Bacteroidota bacterium]